MICPFFVFEMSSIPNFFFQISSVRLPQRSRNSYSTLLGSLKQFEIIPPLKTAATMPVES
jgi:hypothetical protein